MRLRKKNVSRVAAVAMAAAMTVSMAAPAAVAATAVEATNNVAVEAATDTAQKKLTVYYQLEDGTCLDQTGSTSVDADGEFEYPATSIPEGYEAIGDLTYNATYLTDSLYIPVRKVATTKVVKINFFDETANKQIAEPELTVAADATYVNSSKLTAPMGYELCETGDFAIRDGYVYVAVRKVATTKVVKINFYSEDENKQIAEPELTVAADATYINTSILTAPEGYEIAEVGDLVIRDGYVYVPVRVSAKTFKFVFRTGDAAEVGTVTKTFKSNEEVVLTEKDVPTGYKANEELKWNFKNFKDGDTIYVGVNAVNDGIATKPDHGTLDPNFSVCYHPIREFFRAVFRFLFGRH